MQIPFSLISAGCCYGAAAGTATVIDIMLVMETLVVVVAMAVGCQHQHHAGHWV